MFVARVVRGSGFLRRIVKLSHHLQEWPKVWKSKELKFLGFHCAKQHC
jgi:hypothetical protein